MLTRSALHISFSITLIICLLLTSATPIAQAQETDTLFLPLVSGTSTDTTEQPLLYRTKITVKTPAQWRDLARLEILILDRSDDWAMVLVDDLQLEDLARLRYNPVDTNALATLFTDSASVKQWDSETVGDVRSLLDKADEISAKLATVSAAEPTQAAALRNELRRSLRGLDATVSMAIASAATVDSDGDGLTDDQEGFWCTDKSDPDSDFDGTSDGDEVTALKAWMNNELWKFPETGKPFDQWPPDLTNCSDSDKDSVPDRAESRELGLNAGRESTDRDKFDDGQELFGQTNCTGQGGFCSYGPLPRNEDWGVIFAEMPSWVKSPGNHPLVAAFPVPEIDVVESSFKISLVTTMTDGQTTLSGVERSYSTAKTEGTSTSVANTVTWNEWQEVSESLEQPAITSAAKDDLEFKTGFWEDFKKKAITTGKYMYADLVAKFGCLNQSASVDFKPGGIGVGGEISYDDQFTNASCRGALRKARSISPEFATDFPEEENKVRPGKVIVDPVSDVSVNTQVLVSNNFDTDNIASALNGVQFAQLQSAQILGQRLYDISVALTAPRLTTTNSNGKSWGGSQTTTNAQYEEHTVTNGEAFLSQESWSKATAVDTAHTADLSFAYKIQNMGNEYAREIANLAFNLYIGDDRTPAYTYFVAPDIGGSGKFQNLMPSEEHIYTSRRIPLSLEQMKAIDLGDPILIVVEDFTYGIDELFYQDAANAGVLLAIEDGTDDGNETIDTYLIPTWGVETVLQVMARYFPHETDADGTIIAIWTPEYRSDTPSWCQASWRPSDQPSKVLWCKHSLSTADWWNVYTDGLGDGSEGFQDTAAVPGSVALFRFNKDSDLDGFSDRSEARLGTDHNDVSSFPHPELLAGVHSLRNGNHVTSTLSLLNRGVYDAYGVEAVMVAPDESISIENNTVGGSGRVRALKQVIVGSRILAQNLVNTPWTQANHAQPALGGYYVGNEDRTYTFTVNCGLAGGCKVGEDNWSLNWSDDTGNSGALAFGSSYKSPTFQAVGNWGVTLALYSGQVSNGESFTVAANTPRDTFQYTINHEPYTPPLVIVSYNDPQGNHRFVIPPQAMELSTPSNDLSQFAGEMLENVGVEIVTSQPFTPTVNTNLSLLVNNPSDKTLTNANLFLELINISGTVVAEISTQVTLLPGPKATQVTFNSNSFSPAYQADEDYIMMAFLTDYQGNILDTAGRPLSSFQADPLPKFVADDNSLIWNFGTVQQGTLLKHRLAIANTGFGRLYTYINPATGLALSNGSPTTGAADTPPVELTLRTANLPVGGYDQTIYLATSDPQNPSRTVRVLGTITAPSADTPGGSLQRPLDFAVAIDGSHTQGEWITFTHTLTPTPQSLQPIRVYSQNYGTLFGVGKYATEFGQGTASYDMFGDGRDGEMPGNGNLDNDKGFAIGIVNSGSLDSTTITVADTLAVSRIKPGDMVLIHQTQGANAGCWELNKSLSQFHSGEGTYQMEKPLKCAYYNGGDNRAQILRVPQYSTCNVTGTVTPLKVWDGNSGGIFAVMCKSSMAVSGNITTNAIGYRGGLGDIESWGWTGEGDQSPSIRREIQNPPGNGGGAFHVSCAGGGNGTPGISGGESTVGDPAGTPDLVNMVMGGGGGGASDIANSGNGGSGGGMIALWVNSASITGFISSNGGRGQDVAPDHRGGCGGAGGSIFIRAQNINTNSDRVTALAGIRGDGAPWRQNGDGGAGRIRIEYCESLTGTTNPAASTQRLNCYIIEQVESAPYQTARLNLPESFNNGKTYNVQFGRKLDFASADNQLTTLRFPGGMLGSAKFDLLASGMTTTSTVSIDIGDDSTVDWSGSFANNSSNTSPELADAFNAYWAAHGASSTGTLDVPLRVSSDAAAQLLITNLQITSAASRVRHIRLPAKSYTQFLLDFTVGDSGSIVAALDIGDNGSIDWSTPSANGAPARWKTGDLKAALNSYLSGKSGEVTVPIRFYVSPSGSVKLNDYSATFAPSGDVVAFSLSTGNGQQVTNAAVGNGNLTVQEGDIVPLNATINNPSSSDSGPLTAAFFAYAEGWGDWYIGSSFISNIAAGGSAQFSTQWNTAGFGSDKPVSVKVVVNPYGRMGETNYDNNVKSTTVTVTPIPLAQILSFAPIGTKWITESPISLVATASSGLTVTFASLTPGICTVSGSSVTLLQVGTCKIQASQAGNAFYKSTTAQQSFTVRGPAKQEQAISFTPISTKTYGDPPFTLSATATSGLLVSFASQNSQICTVNGSKATIVTAGNCTILASQGGNNDFNSATAVTQTIMIQKAAQSINFVKPADQLISAGSLTLVATASSTLVVTFTSQTPEICTVSNNRVTLLKTGTCSIQASQVGDNNHKAAPSIVQSFAITEEVVNKFVYLPLMSR